MVTETEAGARLAIAGLVGMAVGLEREWSGQASGPNARFAGLRTFLLLGLCGGIAGLLVTSAAEGLAAVVVAGVMALTVAAYVTATRRPDGDVGGTTEVAALAVVALGIVAGNGWLVLAAGTGSVVVLALSEKTRLHWLVKRVGETELKAALQFAVLALVVLPILPDGPFGGRLAIQPRAIWMLVLLFSGLNFAAYLVRRALGPHAAYLIAGLTGGLVSSTAVTLDFARRSLREPAHAAALAFGVIGACTVLIPRVVAVSSLLNASVGLALARLLWLPAVVGGAATFVGWRLRKPVLEGDSSDVKSPLRLGAAIQMAVAFQVALSAIAFVRDQWGTTGVYATATFLGLTDVDALTVGMSRPDAGLEVGLAAHAITAGILANTGLKALVALSLGSHAFGRIAVAGLAGLGAVTAIAFVLW